MMVIPQTRTWHPEPAPASGAATRPERTPEKKPSKPVEPDVELQGKHIKAHLVTGEVITGMLRRTSVYSLVFETSHGARVSIYKHAVTRLEVMNGA